MKQKVKLDRLEKPTRLFQFALLLLGFVSLFTGCFLKQDRTTTIYGTITDQNQQPVDSILVIVDGVQGFKYEILKEAYSDKNGNYEIVMEVPKKYTSVVANIPYDSFKNPKYRRGYVDFYAKKNGVNTGSCCFASIGQKTRYDFQLVPK